MTAEAGIHLLIGGTLGGEFTPPDRGRTWQQRWEQVQHLASRLESPLSEASSGALQQWRQDLHSFFIHCYHIKDALGNQAPRGVTLAVVESAINASQELTLVANLANLDKHDRLSRVRPRENPAAQAPRYGTLYAKTRGADWHPRLEIHSGSTTHDALELVREAVRAWQSVLDGLGLV